jgi:acetyl esterase/lipase
MSDALTPVDIAYQNKEFIADAADYELAWLAESVAYRENSICELDISYGDHPRARYDMFWPRGTPLGLMVFIHGGYWKARAKSDWSHFAQGAVKRGYAVAMMGYPLAPEVRIREITSFVSFGILTASARVMGPLVVAGHSAGGHLAARMAMPGGLAQPAASRLARVLAISPVSDLRPLIGSRLGDELQINAKEADDESLVLGTYDPSLEVSVAVGSEERPAFLDQARWLSEAWDCEQMILPGRHHFDVLDDLKDPDSRMVHALLG